jgi:hypothetical protein
MINFTSLFIPCIFIIELLSEKSPATNALGNDLWKGFTKLLHLPTRFGGGRRQLQWKDTDSSELATALLLSTVYLAIYP